MEAKEKDILNELIAGTKCQFVIPVFQRNYDWRLKECNRLFDDIVDLAKDTDHPERKHFIGAFVYNFTKFVDTSYNQYVLIDGQQRLISITLLLKALCDYLGTLGEEYEEMLSEINETYLINKFAKDSNLKLKLKPNKVDNDTFNRLMNGESIGTDTTIGINYHNFRNRLENMEISINSFYNAMQRLEGVAVILDKDDNPQVIFESLNSTGLELTDVDLIRNYMLMNCKADVQERLYKQYWLKVEQELGDSFLQFFRDYLSLKNGIVTSSAKNRVYYAFQKFYTKEERDKETFLIGLSRLATIYRRLIVPTADSKGLLNALTDYVSLDMTTTYPFVFGLLIDNTPDENGNKKISDSDLEKILRLLESYLIRRNVCNLAGGGLSQVMASLYNSLDNEHGINFYNNSFEFVSMALATITTKAYFPKDEEFVRELTNRDMFKNRNIFYILKKLETQKQGKEVIDFDSLTIEHVLPQKLSDEWIAYLNRADYNEFHSSYVNRIGNLTLTAYNSEMSNKLFKEKKAHTDFSRLVLNNYFKNIDDWNSEECIDIRAKKMAESAKSIWPYPAISNIESISTVSNFLLDDEEYNYGGTTPVGLEIRGEKFLFDSWTSLYIDALRYLYKENKDLFLSVFEKPGYFFTDKKMISSENCFRDGIEVCDGIYTECNFNTERRIKNLKQIFKDFEYESDEIIVFIK